MARFPRCQRGRSWQTNIRKWWVTSSFSGKRGPDAEFVELSPDVRARADFRQTGSDHDSAPDLDVMRHPTARERSANNRE
jgi:hypothetical protein